ncbi:galactosylceramide sulfotransferase-like [Glandiceps talaboti]
MSLFPVTLNHLNTVKVLYLSLTVIAVTITIYWMVRDTGDPLSSVGLKYRMTMAYRNSSKLPLDVSAATMESCQPKQRVVFLKVHKTGSTTMASIIERFAYTRNLSAAVPRSSHILSLHNLFQRKMLDKSPPPLNGQKYYDVITNHVRYNRPEMEAVFPNATYVTTIRHLVQQLESAFGYFEWSRFTKDKSFSTFMQNPQQYVSKRIAFWQQIHNGQLYDLGMSPNDVTNDSKVRAKINALINEMDFVVITEYFDESLLVLKKIMCWTLYDILYIPNGIRNDKKRSKITEDVRKKILEWNKSDLSLYEHFNRTLWQKISQYGPTFEQDLHIFRHKRELVMDNCLSKSSRNNKDRRETRYVLKPNSSEMCTNLWRGDVTFTKLLRGKQTKGRIVHLPTNITRQHKLKRQ